MSRSGFSAREKDVFNAQDGEGLAMAIESSIVVAPFFLEDEDFVLLGGLEDIGGDAGAFEGAGVGERCVFVHGE